VVSGEGGSESRADTGHMTEENDELGRTTCQRDLSIYLLKERKGIGGRSQP
jgi:hypothetical protein